MQSVTPPSLINDQESRHCLFSMMEQDPIRTYRLPGVRTVLVVLSSAGIVFDLESLRQKIIFSYPDASVYFLTTLGKSIGPESPDQVDLLIDLTGPRQRQSILFAKKMRRIARIAIGRNVGLFRKKIYDRVFDEKIILAQLPQDVLEREQEVQKKVLALAGVPFVRSGCATPDLSDTIALGLPPMQQL